MTEEDRKKLRLKDTGNTVVVMGSVEGTEMECQCVWVWLTLKGKTWRTEAHVKPVAGSHGRLFGVRDFRQQGFYFH